jgi:hypothetical protein
VNCPKRNERRTRISSSVSRSGLAPVGDISEHSSFADLRQLGHYRAPDAMTYARRTSGPPPKTLFGDSYMPGTMRRPAGLSAGRRHPALCTRVPRFSRPARPGSSAL